jgi:hypothetical protein
MASAPSAAPQAVDRSLTGTPLGSADLAALHELVEAVDKAMPPRSIKDLWDKLGMAAQATVQDNPNLAMQIGSVVAQAEGLSLGSNSVTGSVAASSDGVLAQASRVTSQAASADALSLAGNSFGMGVSGLSVHDLEVRDAVARADNNGLGVDAGGVDFTNTSMDHISGSFTGDHLGGAAQASDVVVHDVNVGRSSLRASRDGLGVHTEGVDFMNTRMRDAAAGLATSSGHGVSAGVDQAAFHDLSVGESSLQASRDGVQVATEGVDFVNTRASGFQAEAHTAGGYSASHSVDEAVLHDLHVGPSSLNADRDGLAVNTDGVDFTNTAVSGWQANAAGPSGRGAQMSVDDATLHELHVCASSLNVNQDGLSARSDRVQFKNADVNGLSAFAGNQETGNGLAASAGRIEAHELDAQNLAFDTNLRSTRASTGPLSYRQARVTDGHVAAQYGQAGAQASVDQATVNDLSLGRADLALDDGLVKGSASVEDANLVAHDLKGASAQASWGGNPVLGASGDLYSAYAAQSASASWDASQGQAAASVEGFRHDRRLSNGSLNLMGHELDVPQMALGVQADAHASVDLSRGEFGAGLNLAGSELSVGESSWQLPEWAQAGVDASLEDRNLDLNIGGHEIDVDEGIRKAYGGLRSLFGFGDD